MSEVVLRVARTPDVQALRRLVGLYTQDGRLLAKAPVTLYEDVQEFIVAEVAGEVIGCGALHVMWEDLGEIRTLAVDPEYTGRGIGGDILSRLVDRAKDLGLQRLFCLTFETAFFQRHGFDEIEGSPVEHDVFEQLLQSYDEGVAEFLDLERVKPNTLGNHRMLMLLT
jgi:amino-acid N-acetyltransferase